MNNSNEMPSHFCLSILFVHQIGLIQSISICWFRLLSNTHRDSMDAMWNCRHLRNHSIQYCRPNGNTTTNICHSTWLWMEIDCHKIYPENRTSHISHRAPTNVWLIHLIFFVPQLTLSSDGWWCEQTRYRNNKGKCCIAIHSLLQHILCIKPKSDAWAHTSHTKYKEQGTQHSPLRNHIHSLVITLYWNCCESPVE